MDASTSTAARPAERLDEALPPIAGERLFILYGPGGHDRFLDPGYAESGIEEALADLLRARGFERIVFSKARDPIYFHDRASHEVSARRTGEQPAAAGPPRMRHFEGPQGDRNWQAGADAGPRHGLREQLVIPTLDGYMRQEEVRTAIVIVGAEEWLRYIEAPRDFSALLSGWARELSGHNHNTCLLLFDAGDREDLARSLRDRSSSPPALEAFVERQQRQRGDGSLARVGGPPAAEMERLLQLLRLTRGLQMDPAERGRLAEAMASEDTMLFRWQQRLDLLIKESVELTSVELRRRGWLDSEGADGRSAMERLEDLTGLTTVKERVRDLAAVGRVAAERRRQGVGAGRQPPSLHLVFAGNPGTGKTTVARLVGELYRELGLLRRGHVFSPRLSDLIAGYEGQTHHLVNSAIDRALDGVLFLDEAYRLTDEGAGPFAQQAMSTLLERMENERDRLAVIVAGYPDRMRAFLDSNPGLRSRFPESNVIEFPDYGSEELLAILRGELSSYDLTCTPEMDEQLRRVVAGVHDERDEGFGNGRAMRDLAQELDRRWASRIADAGLGLAEPLRPPDLPERYRRHLRPEPPPVEEVLRELDEMVGLETVRENVRDLVLRIQQSRRRPGRSAVVAPHMVFAGPPGTGKTTVARVMGRAFHALGLLKRGHVVEVTPSRLVAGYVRQTGPNVIRYLDEARDGVLFIDEAYGIARGGEHDFGQEAIDALVPELENRRGRVVVIAAGYPEPMQRFLDMNEGLRDRFTHTIRFPHLGVPELVETLRRMADRDGYELPDEAAERAGAYLGTRMAAEGERFANVRTVRKLFEAMQTSLARRTSGLPDGDPAHDRLEAEDVPGSDPGREPRGGTEAAR